MREAFCGWYYRCQAGERALAVIPAVHSTGGARTGSVQLITDAGHWSVDLPGEQVKVDAHRPRAAMGSSLFSEDGLRLNLRTDSLSATGELRFGAPTPIRYDIMGPFRRVPVMECRHSVFSMRHEVNGLIQINGTEYRFENAAGYIEGDRGRSFPAQYAWTQSFFDEGSLMLSVAEIPLGPLRFTGVIGVVRLDGREYRLATYLGARAERIADGEIAIRQGELTLTAALLEKRAHPLNAPLHGGMTRVIRENVACRARYALRRGDEAILALETDGAAFEFEYGAPPRTGTGPDI